MPAIRVGDLSFRIRFALTWCSTFGDVSRRSTLRHNSAVRIRGLALVGAAAIVSSCSFTSRDADSIGPVVAAAPTITDTSNPPPAPADQLVLSPDTTVILASSDTLRVDSEASNPATVAAPFATDSQIQPLDTELASVGHENGEPTKAVQSRLLELGFWHAGVDGDYGITTTQAVMAFQKYVGLEATGDVGESTAVALSTATERARGRADTGDLVEIDKARQLLFIVRGGNTIWTLNTSTGNGLPYEQPDENTPGEIIRSVALTPDGLWKVNRERVEGWWEGDLGEIYRPKYFRGGIAVHGAYNIPNYPASHGCVRVSVPAMDFIWEQDLMPMRSTVWVHDG